ncbi:chemotaxis protein CheW [Methylovulum psychrotolerans]|jgi:twitching motility protein PilI|uniref:CheW-like domain-containing protein n=1 Tax=Methylovulum psychrotolerans TaxID=1704499 RepID=A0A1Z4C1F2_9GAMM|nr:chemotaxis protein CheW [Methylovulum psychrotolerans]ASF47368.1 hypothetical protein CEK71_15575 [Methylovulum psychrotolerans]POZ51039.1 hypothetical protein AADEFJLK_02997 [Methylovulum psychrotolerans]
MAVEHPNTAEKYSALSSSFADAPEIAATVLGFRIGDLGFLLPISLHCEVIGHLPVNPIPRVKPWFSGLLNMRGTIVPVVDLYLLPNTVGSPPKKRYLLTIGRGEKTVALWIDGYPLLLPDMATPLPSLPPLPELLQPCVSHAYSHDGQIWLQAEFGALFATLGNS